MRSVPLIRCLPKMSSSSNSTGSQIATWRRSLTWTRHDFSFDLRSPSTGKMFVWSPAFLPEPGSTRYSSALSIATVWSNCQTLYNDFFEVYNSNTVTLSSTVQKMVLPLVQLNQSMSRDQSFFVLIGQIAFSWYSVMINHKYVNVQTYQLLDLSKINNGWSMAVTVLQRKASVQQIGLPISASN